VQASDVSCAVVVGLMGRWHDGDMDERDRDAYEQHLLFCPPCLQQNGKTRRVLAALARIAAEEPDGDLVHRLTRSLGAGDPP
jgi:hypothetical protein